MSVVFWILDCGCASAAQAVPCNLRHQARARLLLDMGHWGFRVEGLGSEVLNSCPIDSYDISGRLIVALS